MIWGKKLPECFKILPELASMDLLDKVIKVVTALFIVVLLLSSSVFIFYHAWKLFAQ